MWNIKKLNDINNILTEKCRTYSYDIIGCCQEVHKELGPYLNEYIYQDALEIILKEKNIEYLREYNFNVDFHGMTLKHQHYMDFLCKKKIILECKAVDKLVPEHRQQLWNYMRLAKINIGILYNFALPIDQCERYYYDITSKQLYMF